MQQYDFSLDGVSALGVGIRLQSPVKLSAAVPIAESVQVPGRNGTLIMETGAYKNRKAEADCFALKAGVIDTMNEISRFLFSKGGYRRLEVDYDEEHYMLARVKNGAELAPRLKTLNPFEIEFDCKPQRFLKSGEREIVFEGAGELVNVYGFPANPLIKVYGDGAGIVTIGEKSVEILDMDGYLILDCETMNAYQDGENKNLYINAREFPTLTAGANTIAFSGAITSLAITPRWWEL